jgi:outer membrane murein-binding lipoprotein Lpp
MRRFLTALVVALVLLAGCAGAGNSEDSGEPDSVELADQSGGDAGDGGDGGDGGERPEQSGDAGAPGEVNAAVQERAIIRTGTVRIEVENATTSRETLQTRARELGGYTAGSELTRHRRNNATWKEGYLVVRVPSENFSAMQDGASAQGVVRSENTETEDVTDQLVDLNARLENLRAERDQLRRIYNRSNSTEDVLAVQERLSDVQGEIERLEAQKRSLEDRVAYSTLRIELREPQPEGTTREVTPFHEQSPLSALNNSVATLVQVLRTLFLLAVIAAPWLAVAAIPVGIAGVLVHRFVGDG